MNTALRRIFTVNLRTNPHARVLVLADLRMPFPRPVTALAFAAAEEARKTGVEVCFSAYQETGRHGVEPPEGAWRAAFGDAAITDLKKGGLLERLLAKRATPAQVRRAEAIVRRHRRDAPDTAVLMTWFSATHTRLRRFLTDVCGCRVASMPSFTAPMLKTAMTVDYAKMARRSAKVAAGLRRADRIRVTSPDGTDLTFSIRGRQVHAETGLPGRGQMCNLPAGEVYVAVVEDSAEGTLAGWFGPHGILKPPILFRIRRGRVVAVKGGGMTGKEMTRIIRRDPRCGVVAEFGVGVNDRANARTTSLESEKMLGTIHVAFGDNSTFGGRNSAPAHLDFVVRKPGVRILG